jgi:heme-degrading monooxygenase HmoA
MIIRVFEARLKPGREHDFMAGERELLGRTDIDGLLGVSIGRRLSGGAMHVITLTVWRDLAAIAAFSGSPSSDPVFLNGSDEMVESWSLHHYEGVDASEPSDVGDRGAPTSV